jgi:hypothetical protein
VPAIERLIDRFAKADIPVIWTVQEDFAVDTGRPQGRLAVICLNLAPQILIQDRSRRQRFDPLAEVLKPRTIGR